MLHCPRDWKSLNSIERTQLRMMCALFNGKLSTNFVSCYSPTNAGDETDITTFFNGLSFLVRHIPKHNTLMIDGDMNTQIGNNENNKFSLDNLPNRNCEYLTDISPENSLSCLYTKFHTQRKNGANSTSIWFCPKSYNDVLRKHESNGLFTWWRHWHQRDSHGSFARRCMTTIFA